jgi:hypothetical protein
MRQELLSVEIPNLEDYEPEPAEPSAVEDPDGWLFDSSRDYIDQLDAYKRYGSGE